MNVNKLPLENSFNFSFEFFSPSAYTLIKIKSIKPKISRAITTEYSHLL